MVDFFGGLWLMLENSAELWARNTVQHRAFA